MGSKRKRVAILFGGRSSEHEVSLVSARNVAMALDREDYELVLIGIDRNGKWHLDITGEKLIKCSDVRSLVAKEVGPEISLTPSEHGGRLVEANGSSQFGSVDVVFPVLHGPYGEDGTIQGLLKLANIPFVGPSILGSAVGMDKDVMKRLLRDAGIPIGNFLVLHHHEPRLRWSEVIKKLGSPVFIKPANLGSSVGISKVSDEQGYEQAVDRAFQYDRKILLEETIQGREIECAVLGNENPRASLPGEIIPQSEFYTYEAKYLDENGAILKIPAELSKELVAEVQDLSIKTFKALCCEGMGRVDLFLTSQGKLLVNEINTIPGFTEISMYPKLWEASGLSYKELISELIRLAVDRHEKESRLSTSF